MEWTFPRIKIRKTAKEQIIKIAEETEEFLLARTAADKDIEAIDIYHAAETLLRIRFKGREDQLDKLVDAVISKNRARNKY